MSSFTPGPWRVEQDTTLIWGDCNPGDETNHGMGYPIAECGLTPTASWAKGPRKYVEAEANARLIAAAPDLLEALKGAIGALEFSRDYHADLSNAEQAFAQDKLDAALAALAKAEGAS